MKCFLHVIFVLTPLYIFSQSNMKDENTNLITSYFQGVKQAETNNLSNNNDNSIKNNTLKETNTFYRSYVHINQIGNHNFSKVSIRNDFETITQKGSKNSYESYGSPYTDLKTTTEVIQEGVSNSLQIYGKNSLMDNITINQKSNFKTIVIKNYQN